MSQLRWHPLLEEWVAVAAHRQERPIALAAAPGRRPCPFCPGGAEGLNAPYEFVALENRYPSFVRVPGLRASRDARGLYRAAPGRGACEVLLYSDRHDETLADASQERLDRLARVWTDRYLELGSRREVKYVYVFENKGAAIGVTLSHPHGQIYAFPYLPPRVRTELAAEERYRRRHGACLLCDLVRAELEGGDRVVATNGAFAAYVPYFARYPYEVHLVPRRHLGHLGEMSDRERWEFAGLLRVVLGKYDALFGFSLPYIMLMHQTPTDGRRWPGHHFHVEFYPPNRSRDKLKYLAGCESGAGTFINDTIPEAKAAELRRATPRR